MFSWGRGVGMGIEEVPAGGSPAQCALEVWGALERRVPVFQGSSWIPVDEAARRPRVHSL